MKKYLIVFVFSIATLMNACTDGQSQTSNANLSATDFQKKMKELPTAALIDVRTPGEYNGGHLQNSKNINLNDPNFESEISKLNKNTPVFVYCLSGARSSYAANKMLSWGFKDVYNMDGGIMKWRAAGLPETTGTTNANEISGVQFEGLINTEKLVLIDFYAEWCVPCKKMAPYLEELKKELSDKVSIIRINADDSKSLSKELKVDALPALFLYKNKKIVWSFSGYISKEDLVKQLKL